MSRKRHPQHRERRQGARCRLVERVIAEFGHLDVLMNNAAARAMSRTLGGPL